MDDRQARITSEGYCFDEMEVIKMSDKPDPDTKKEAAKGLRRAADDIEENADKIDEDKGRAAVLREDAEKVRNTADYLEDEASTEELDK